MRPYSAHRRKCRTNACAAPALAFGARARSPPPLHKYNCLPPICSKMCVWCVMYSELLSLSSVSGISGVLAVVSLVAPVVCVVSHFGTSPAAPRAAALCRRCMRIALVRFLSCALADLAAHVAECPNFAHFPKYFAVVVWCALPLRRSGGVQTCPVAAHGAHTLGTLLQSTRQAVAVALITNKCGEAHFSLFSPANLLFRTV